MDFKLRIKNFESSHFLFFCYFTFGMESGLLVNTGFFSKY